MGTLKVDGNLLLTGDIRMQTSNVLSSVIQVKADSNDYGQNLLIGAGGNTVIGGGESAQTFFAASGIKDEENLYLTADGNVHIYTNCDQIANRKLVMSLNADGTIDLPNSKKIDTDGTFSGSAAGLYRMNHFTTEAQVDNFQAPNTLQYCTIGAEYTPIGNDGILISAGWYSGRYGAQIWIDDGGGSGGMKIRSFGANNGANWNEWQTVLTSGNYNSYTVTKTGSGASGTWGINVTGSAGSVTWGNVTGKPSTFTPSSHTHSYLPLSGGTMTGTIITPGNDSVVIKPANHNYDQIGASDCKFWKVFATTFYGNLSGNADTATTASAVAWGNVTGKPSTFTPSSHTHDYLPLSGGSMTGKLQVNNIIFGYNYTNNNNAPAFVWDKPGSYFTGIGASGTDTIKFGPVESNGTFSWVSGFAQHWVFQGTIRPGCIILTNDQWTGYGTADPNDLDLDKVVGRLYFKI